MFPKELFYPKSVAVLGASRNPGKVGHGVFTNLAQTGFPGEIYGVNPAGGGVLGRAFYRDIGAIPRRVGLGACGGRPPEGVAGGKEADAAQGRERQGSPPPNPPVFP